MPFTLMLKTSGSTKSTTRPRKGRVGVGDNGSDDGSDNGGHFDGGSRNGNSDKNSSDAPKLMCPPTSCTSRLRTSASTDSLINAIKIVVDFDGIDDCGGRSGDFDETFQVTRWRSKQYSSARTTVAFDLRQLRLYPLGQNVNSDRKKFASRVGRVHSGRLWPKPKSV